MAKTPALSTQLKTANARIEQLEKELKSAKDAKDNYYKYWQDAENQINQIHNFFDAMPDAIPKDAGDFGKTNSIMIRLAAWLATRK